MTDLLKATHEKDNFQRLARLLFCGGKQLLKEVFDSHFHPTVLPSVLRRYSARTTGRCPFNPRERSLLYNSSSGVYSTSADFDITMLFKLVRHLCNLPIPATGWDSLPPSTDDTLSADLARIKFYRNQFSHDNNNMEIDDARFLLLWQEISEAIVRIAKSISDEKGKAWKSQINSLRDAPLTKDDYEEIKKELHENTEELRKLRGSLTGEIQGVKNQVQENSNQLQENSNQLQENTKQLRELTEGIAELTMKVDCEKMLHRKTQSAIPDSAGGCAGYQEVTSKQILTLIGIRYLQVVQPSNSYELSRFNDYMSKMEVAIQNFTIGSLLITLNISTLPILERLWQDYCSGHLGEVVQNALATDEIMNDLGLTELKLKTTILEEDYRACKQTLKEFADAGVFLS
ncbi:hypothetical protein ACROYT_G037328 [Oculina patagonica]